VPADLLELRVTIAAPVDRVWTALTDTGAMAEWMGEPGMALVVDTDWAPGSGIVVRGEHNGPFENDGIVLRHQPPERLAYTHRSSVSGLPDDPSSYTTLEFVLAPAGNGTALTLRASDFPTESIFKHLRLYWLETLQVLKGYLEGGPSFDI
jgi:uncharacterized protein YndB with AHSA1/START domain